MTEKEYNTIVPSSVMRDYLESNGWKFSPAQRACLIWNSKLPLLEKIDCLRQIRNHTGDTKLIGEIDACLESMDTVIEDFKNNDVNQYVYSLYIRDAADGKFGILSYYKNYHEAYSCGQTLEEEFLIVRNMFSQTGKSYYAEMHFDSKGECTDFISSDTNNIFYMNSENFTGMYISIPHPFKRGDVVYEIGGDCYGVVASTEPKRESCNSNTKSTFADSMIVISYPDDHTGLLENKEVNPLHLRYFEMKIRPDRSNLIASILYSVHEIYTGKGSLVDFCDLQIRLFQRCQIDNYRKFRRKL